MKNVSVLLCFLFLFSITKGQSNLDFIEMRSDGYFHQKQKTNKKELAETLIKDEEAYVDYKKYKTNRNIARIVGTTGVLISGYKLAILAYSGEFYAGGGRCYGSPVLCNFPGLTLIIAGSIFYGFSVNKFRKSVDIYNGNLKKSNNIGSIPSSLGFGISIYGIGFTLNF